MPQTMYCDVEGCGLAANMIFTVLDNGEARAYCWPHWADVITAQVRGIEEEERRQAEETAEQEAAEREEREADPDKRPPEHEEPATLPVGPPDGNPAPTEPEEQETAPSEPVSLRRARPALQAV